MKLLVLRLSALGDVIHTIPAVLAIRDALPPGSVRWAVEQPYRDLVETVAAVETVPMRLKKWGRSPAAYRTEIREAWNGLRGAGTSIDFQGLLKSAMLGWLAGAPVRAGFAANAIREKPALLFLNRRVRVDTSRHVVDQNLELAQQIVPGGAPGPGNWSAFASDPKGRLAGLEGAVVLLPGAGKPEKIWKPERLGEVGRRIGGRVVVAWGPGERQLAEATGIPLAPETNLRELAWLLGHASLVIGGDTGPIHMAAALGTEVIGLYGPTNPRRNGPYGQLERCVSHFETTKSMDSISVEEVMNQVRSRASS